MAKKYENVENVLKLLEDDALGGVLKSLSSTEKNLSEIIKWVIKTDITVTILIINEIKFFLGILIFILENIYAKSKITNDIIPKTLCIAITSNLYKIITNKNKAKIILEILLSSIFSRPT